MKEIYTNISVFAFTLIVVCELIGIDVEVKPFKYSLKNILK